MSTPSLPDGFPPRDVEEALADIERALEQELGGEQPWAAPGRHLVLAPGAKRARPRLCVLWGEMLGAPRADVRHIAVAVELIHSASLLHDDVVDAGTVRRGRATANVRFGPAIAVLSGDVLLTRALRRLRERGPALAARALDVVEEMSAAAVAEVAARAKLGLTRTEWLHLAEGKTGALFGLCGALVAEAIGDAAMATRLERVGRSLGLAFQARDDVLDLWPGREGAFADLTEGNPSLPLVLAAESDAQVRSLWQRAWDTRPPSAERIAELGSWLRRSAGVTRALAVIGTEVERARGALGDLATRPQARAVLCWADSLLTDPRVEKETAA